MSALCICDCLVVTILMMSISKCTQVGGDQAWIIAFAAFLANYAESLLGAFLQGKEGYQWLSNDIVNILQTCLAAYLAMFLIDF